MTRSGRIVAGTGAVLGLGASFVAVSTRKPGRDGDGEIYVMHADGSG